jgi:hypothetical protein
VVFGESLSRGFRSRTSSWRRSISIPTSARCIRTRWSYQARTPNAFRRLRAATRCTFR